MHLPNLCDALLLAQADQGHSPFSAPFVDVAIVGAGLAGLSAARDLSVAKKSVLVLEGRDRVGGRVENMQLANGGVTELGAAFVGPTQDRVLATIQQLGLTTFPEYNKGNNIVIVDGQRLTYSTAASLSSLPIGNKTISQVEQTITLLDTMASELDVYSPWAHPNASAWDTLTFDSWLKLYATTETARFIFDVVTTSVFSAEPDELSLLYVIAYIAASGNQTETGTWERLIGTAGGAQASRIVGGTGLIATGLAEEIGWHNIALEAPVRAISEYGSGYLVEADTRVVCARQVVVAMSPPLAARIIYNPPLPAARDQLTQRMFMGALGKATAIYETPFWREDGWSGQAVGDTGVVRTTFDVSPANGSYGAILGFIEADEMRALDNATEAEIAALVTQDYVRYFGPKAANVTQWAIKRWDNNVFSRGGPVALAGPGTLTNYGPDLRKIVGGIHWAGTETAEYWTGYMDGAIRSGERVAREILGVLG